MASPVVGNRFGRPRTQMTKATITGAITGTSSQITHATRPDATGEPAFATGATRVRAEPGPVPVRRYYREDDENPTPRGGAPVTNLPFGFGQQDDESGEPAKNPFGDPMGGMFGLPVFGELQKLLSWTGGPVNWDLAKQLAEQTLAGHSRSVTPVERAAIAEAIRLADLWLDDTTDFPSGVQTVESWTRLEWLNRTLPVWRSLCEPVAARVVAAMSNALPAEQLEQLGQLGAGNPLAGIMSQVGGLMFGAQVGQGLGGLAQEVLSATDIGIPLGPSGTAALVAENVATFGAGLERPEEEIRLYLALREAAHQRLFAHVPWLRQRLLDTVEEYARGITIDISSIESAMQGIDPMNPEGMQDALTGGLFNPQQTPEQAAALRRLETLLALVEGWVDSVVAAGAGPRMPGADALREASRRRRATGGPAEQTFATLVGLELRPRRLREAAALWWSVTEKRGISGRDALWTHPDLLPTPDDLDDPLGYGDKVASFTAPDDLSELDDLPGEGDGDGDGDGGGRGGGGVDPA
jgi:putative hydrolase